MPVIHKSIVSLDVGESRIGVAVASTDVRLPRPLTTLNRNEHFFEKLQSIINEEDCGAIVVGFPRGLQGQITEQTKSIESFAGELKQRFQLPLYFQDESVTSKIAEAELNQRGKRYKRGDIDSLAATYILEDFLGENKAVMESDE